MFCWISLGDKYVTSFVPERNFAVGGEAVRVPREAGGRQELWKLYFHEIYTATTVVCGVMLLPDQGLRVLFSRKFLSWST